MHTDNLVGWAWLSTVRSAGDRWHVWSNWDVEGQQISLERRKPRFIAAHIIRLSQVASWLFHVAPTLLWILGVIGRQGRVGGDAVTPPGKFPVA